jgi:curved DNA-binding protein CbpA
MPARPLLPADDLYARLEVPHDASFEAIEVAWRALLKRHHPDVAGGGADADDRAKRINVAHDWLSDPDLRARYDRERHARAGRAGAGHDRDRRPPTPGSAWTPTDGARSRPSTAPRTPLRRRPADAEEGLARHLDRVEQLTPTEIDRLGLAETPPIAFVASIARFLPPDLLARVEAVEGRVHERLPRAVRWNPGVRDSAVGFGQEIVLAEFLDEHLSGDFRERVRERLTRGWTAAIDQPRYGPNGTAVARAIDRVPTIPADGLRRVASIAAQTTVRGGPPWPAGLRQDEDDALRVSSELARRDAVAALPAGSTVAMRRSLERAIHALVLRHAFPPAQFESLIGPWRGPLEISAAVRPGIRDNTRPRR